MTKTRARVNYWKEVGQGKDPELKKEKEAKTKKQLEDQKKSLMNKLAIAFSTEEGKVALRLIKNLCGYDKYDAVARKDSGVIDELSTFYNTARRSVYLDLRALLKSSILMEIEYEQSGSESTESSNTTQ